MVPPLPQLQEAYVCQWSGDYAWAIRHSVNTRLLTKEVVNRATACLMAKYGVDTALHVLSVDPINPTEREIDIASGTLFNMLDDINDPDRRNCARELRLVRERQ